MKPDFITDTDWKFLKEKYKDDLDEVLQKLNQHYPVQYLIGNVDFFDCKIKVDERVLIPRFETEFLVEKTIEEIKKINLKKPKILDLGTGSGCISIALKKHLDCEITGVDISERALVLAKENAKLNQVEINFKKDDMTSINYDGYDIIISNPPYVSKNIEVGLETKYEPQNAIFAEKNGLYFYEEILKKLSGTKELPKLVAFEIGYEQKEELKKLITNYLSTKKYRFEKDLAGKDRYLFIYEKNFE